jgi:hypothetical protein
MCLARPLHDLPPVPSSRHRRFPQKTGSRIVVAAFRPKTQNAFFRLNQSTMKRFADRAKCAELTLSHSPKTVN